MRDFLESYGLYKTFILHEEYSVETKNKLIEPFDFIGITFEYFCNNENAQRTFEIELPPLESEYYREDLNIANDFICDGKLDYTFKAICKCKSCKKYHVDFIFHVFSNLPIPKLRLSIPRNSTFTDKQYKMPKPTIFIEKIGSHPEIKAIPNETLTKYFDRETNIWYFKGINCINDNYGIGALAYFRKVIEKELIHIVESIKSLPASASLEIEQLLEKHNNNPRVSTIYENIYPYLPNSLQVLGENPIKLLYNQTSEGLHNLTEDECMAKAESIQKLLDFTITKIHEEKSSIKDLKETIKKLK